MGVGVTGMGVKGMSDGKGATGGSGDDVASGAKFVGASVASASIGATAIKKK